jgi:hypothetical protein
VFERQRRYIVEEASAIIEAIKAQDVVFEVREMRRFTAYLKETNEEVEILVSDSGSTEQGRYTASAQVLGSDTRVSASNPEDTAKQAIYGVHWDELSAVARP